MPENSEEFYRIQKLPPYVFAVINEMRAKARAAQIDVIDLGMGNPDGATPARDGQQTDRSVAQSAQPPVFAVAGHSQTARRDRRRYQANYDVDLDPDNEAIVTIGAKDALAHLLFAVVGPGDVVVSPNPAYPIHQYGVMMAEGHACMLPMPDAATFLTAWRISTAGPTSKPKMLLISFPHNPTTTCVDLDFFTRDHPAGARTRHHGGARFRVCRSGFRRLQAAQHSAGSGRQGSSGGDFLAVEELQHGRLAGGLLPGQSER